MGLLVGLNLAARRLARTRKGAQSADQAFRGLSYGDVKEAFARIKRMVVAGDAAAAMETFARCLVADAEAGEPPLSDAEAVRHLEAAAQPGDVRRPVRRAVRGWLCAVGGVEAAAVDSSSSRSGQ